MRFYYFSIFSWLLAFAICLIAVGLFWIVWAKVLKRKYSDPVFWISTAVIFVLPWTEELWIAYQFGYLCRKDAGVFVNKTVEVEGFYDDTSAGSLELVRSGTYRFVEGRSDKGTTRVTLGDADFMHQAQIRYQQANPGRDIAKQEVVRVKVDAQTEALVYPQKAQSWRITTLDRPTARYHYKRLNFHTPVARQVDRFEDVVVDTQTGEILGRYVDYYRGAYWFFISLGRPTINCHETRGKATLIYRDILKPVMRP